jgi:hypothetical protein
LKRREYIIFSFATYPKKVHATHPVIWWINPKHIKTIWQTVSLSDEHNHYIIKRQKYGSCIKDRAGNSGCCQPAAADDTELAVEPNWSTVNWFTTSPFRMATVWRAACLARARPLLGELLVLLPLLGHDPPCSPFL